MQSVTLFVLPYAGGSAAIYRLWAEKMPSWVHLVPLRMPGRGVRAGMKPIHDWPDLLDLLVRDVQDRLDHPYAIFGHSMGALIGMELAYELRLRHRIEPVWMGMSACIAPAMRKPETKWLTCSHSDLMEEVASLNGTAQDVLENQEFMTLMAPILRADFHLCGTYVHRGFSPLSAPMLVLGGTKDEEVMAAPDNLAAWARETHGAFDLQMLDADHFFINTHRNDVIARVVASLSQYASSARPGTVTQGSAIVGP